MNNKRILLQALLCLVLIFSLTPVAYDSAAVVAAEETSLPPVVFAATEMAEIQLSLQAGWNMVSVPVVPTGNSAGAVFPGVAGIFAWNASSRSYYAPTVIEPEKGYWVAVTENTTIAVSGTPVDTWTSDIKAGWNMIGSVNATASIAAPNDDPDASVIPTAYWWDPVSKSYILTTAMEPGKGYWIASVNDCTLTMTCAIPEDAVLAVNEIIGATRVEYWERVINGVFQVKNDYVSMHVDPETNELVKSEEKWRDIAANLTALEIEPFEPPGGEYFSKSVVVFLEEEDVGNFYTFHRAQEYPLVCWEVRYSDGTTAIYDLDGTAIGYGIPAPGDGLSLSGYHNSTYPEGWPSFRKNADGWFQKWSAATTSLSLPTPTTISSYVSDPDYEFYYALAHGAWNHFQANSTGSSYYASTAVSDMKNRGPMLFAFIGHCEGMTQTGAGSFSDAFRKGSMTNTVTVGYSGMGNCSGWPNALNWQDYMFQKMDYGLTMRDAFDLARAQYPLIANHVVFCGDPSLRLPSVHFTDPNLEVVIREAIGKPTGNIYQSDLLGLTSSLQAGERNITDLTGLEYCTNLTYLVLRYNQISDISPVANLTNLTVLDIAYNQISDISPLVNLTNLHELPSQGNQISDISPLANLINLVGLALSRNQISDISPLANLTKLDVLNLQCNQISDISPLVENQGLGEGDQVWLWSNPLSEVSTNISIPQLQARGVHVTYGPIPCYARG